MKILNLYAGIGGNRKLWGDDHEITAIELDANVAAIYQDFFPADQVIIADAHKYLLEHYYEFDFIWSSPPCPTHSRLSLSNHLSPYKDNSSQMMNGGGIKPRYPDMQLYQEIIFLKHFARCAWVIENVIAYYTPLIPPQEIAMHWFWSNFLIRPRKIKSRGHDAKGDKRYEIKGFDLSHYTGIDKRKVLRNCTEPETGQHVLDCLINPVGQQVSLLPSAR